MVFQELQTTEDEAFAEAQSGPSTDPIWWLWLVVALAAVVATVWVLRHYRAGGPGGPGR